MKRIGKVFAIRTCDKVTENFADNWRPGGGNDDIR